MAISPQTLQSQSSPMADDHPARLVINEDGLILFVTNRLARMCGKSPEDLQGRFFTSVVVFAAPDDAFRPQKLFGIADTSRSEDAVMARSLNEGIHDVVLGEQKTELQFDRVRLPDGRSYIIASMAHDAATPDERFIDLIGRLDLKKPELVVTGRIDETSGDSELRHFLNMSHDLMAIEDAAGHIRKVNHTFNTVLGYVEAELEGLSLLELIHPEDKPQVRNTLSALMHDQSRENDIVHCEARLLSKSGNVHWMEWRHKRSGNIIYSVGRDVSAFKNNENILKQREQMLREAQSIGHMGHWRWIVGTKDLQWSDEIYKIFGVSRDSFSPSLDTLNRMTHKRDVGRMVQAFQRAIIEQNDYDMEFRITRPDGDIRHVRCEGRCEHDDHQDVIALFGIMHDVTEQTLNQQHLTEAKDAAERAYAAKSQFLANMSHELRTPLNAIIGFSEMMQRQLLGPIGSARYLDYIAGIRQSGEHLLDLISDILDMSKIEAGKYDLDLEELHISKVIRLAIHMVEGRANEAGITTAIEITNEALQVVADRRALMQILLNLLSNAVKFTEPGGAVRVECLERGDYVSIKIHDTGIGIPANQLKNITRPFEQVSSHYTRKHEGTGLGLAITKELIELHGGSMHLDSTVGIGTIVTIRLPYNAYEAIRKNKQ